MNILRRIFKYIALAVVFIAALVGVGIYNVNAVADVEAKKSSYTRTQFEYFISSPDKNQVAQIENDSSVDKVFPYYALNNAFTQNSSTKEIFLLLSDDMEDYSISLFTEKTCIAGDFDKDGAMLDKLAAEKLGVGVGDTIQFNVLGKSISKTVSAVYLTSTYGTLTKGIVLAEMTSDILSVYSPAAYSAAFITANDDDGVAALLKDYVGEGNVALTYSEYVAINCGVKPPYQTQEEYEASCLDNYEAYRQEVLNAALRGGSQVAVKSQAYALLQDKIATTEKGIDRLNLLAAISSFILFTVINVIFIITNKKNDRIRCDEGMKAIGMAGRYSLAVAVTAIIVAAVAFAVLFPFAVKTFFVDACIKTIASFTLPVLISIIPIIIFVIVYVKILYSNSVKY